MTWFRGRLLAFDTETTGVDPEQARLVQYALAWVGGEAATEATEVLVDPGVEIPAETATVHGITTEQAQAEGVHVAQALTEIVDAIAEAQPQMIPLVGHNLRYDLTVLARECERHGVPDVDAVLGRPLAYVVDTLVLSKHVAPYRRRVSDKQGAHTLKTCVQTWLSAPWDDEAAHGALYDALMSARVAYKLAGLRREIGAVTLSSLFDAQRAWAAEQAASYEHWLRTKAPDDRRDPNAVINPAWPLVPATVKEATAP
ncbi:exonuclease domain-containing protein [Nocardiopsis sp. NPDC101807]|uniref:exonuclease domain-containing protein n=1 Tax=Nocardiopsis sp. NPDC101807 TaxID=3364339 RepID=UPI00382373F7